MSALAALSMAGVPPLLGFVSKENFFEALLEAPGPALAETDGDRSEEG